MKRTFKTVNYEQALDLTARLGDCLPPDHLARFVVDSVALLDLSALYAHYGSRGREPYARRACCWVCFSMAMRQVCSARARSSAPRMRLCHSALSSPAPSPITPTTERRAEPTLATIAPVIGIPAAAALDAGYFGPATLAACAKRSIEPSIATGSDPHHPSPAAAFRSVARSAIRGREPRWLTSSRPR